MPAEPTAPATAARPPAEQVAVRGTVDGLREVPGADAGRVPGGRRLLARPGQPADVPVPVGRVARAGDRVQPVAAAGVAPAGGALRRSAGRGDAWGAAVLRHRHAAAVGRRPRPDREEPRGAAGQVRGQPAAPGQPRRHRPPGAGRPAEPVRPGPVQVGDEWRQRQHRRQGAGRRAGGAGRQQGRHRRRLPDRADHLADRPPADGGPAEDVSEGAVGAVRAGEPGERGRRPRRRVPGRTRRHALQRRRRRRDPVLGRRLPVVRTGGRPLRPRLRCPPQAQPDPRGPGAGPRARGGGQEEGREGPAQALRATRSSWPAPRPR